MDSYNLNQAIRKNLFLALIFAGLLLVGFIIYQLVMPSIHRREAAAIHIQLAADKVGVDFDYLMKTAKRESGYNPSAKARTSTATGLFQFIEQTWLESIALYGEKHGYKFYSDFIERSENGKYIVKNLNMKFKILALRTRPEMSALMAAEYSQVNAQYLLSKIKRKPSNAELYMAHFLGRSAAAKLIKMKSVSPNKSAVVVFPKHAAANKSIFYKNGKPVSVAELYKKLNLAAH